MSAGLPVTVLLWIAFAILVTAALWILLAACGLAWPGGRPMLVFCPVDVAARPVDPLLLAEQERERVLQGSIRDLEIALLERPYCAPPPQPQAQLQPEPEPEPEAEPEPELPSIEDAIREGDEHALAGCWVLTSDFTMENFNTHEPMPVQDWEICFTNDGHGSQAMSFASGIQCRGRASAAFPDDRTLQIDDAGMTCPGFGRTIASTTICRLDSDGSARCLTKDAGSSDEGASTVTIRRKN